MPTSSFSKTNKSLIQRLSIFGVTRADLYIGCILPICFSDTHYNYSVILENNGFGIVLKLILLFYFLQSRNNKCGYIITQQPLKNTITDFWRLIYDHGSNVILTLNALDEDQEVKCLIKYLLLVLAK